LTYVKEIFLSFTYSVAELDDYHIIPILTKISAPDKSFQYTLKVFFFGYKFFDIE